MDAQVPEHHHKDYRIEEIDLIPNGNHVSVVPDWPAPEGTTVNYLNGSDFRLYKMIDGDWRQIGGTSASSAWSLVSYTTAPTGASITIPDLDLDTDLLYDIIVECRNVTNAGILSARVNNDSTAGRHLWASNGNRYDGASNEDNPGESSGATKWDLSHSGGNMSHHASMRLGYNSGTPLASWNTASIGKTGDAANVPAIETGAGFWIHSDNITSLVFSHNSGADCEWKVWVFKAATS